jgi:hypothetical protein
MGTQQSVIDISSTIEIANAIVEVNRSPDLRQAGLAALWCLYYAPQHTLTRVKLEREFGVLADHFGAYARRVAEELGSEKPDELPLANSWLDAHGVEMITLKPSVVTAIRSYAFSKMAR